jgi:hypothetical protein
MPKVKEPAILYSVKTQRQTPKEFFCQNNVNIG